MTARFLKLCSRSYYWFASRLGRFTAGESVPGTHVIGKLVGPRAGLADVDKRTISGPPGNWIQFSGHPVRSLDIIVTKLFRPHKLVRVFLTHLTTDFLLFHWRTDLEVGLSKPIPELFSYVCELDSEILKWDFRFSLRFLWRLLCLGKWRHRVVCEHEGVTYPLALSCGKCVCLEIMRRLPTKVVLEHADIGD